MTDDLVKLARSDEEIIAVLAHEIGHEIRCDPVSHDQIGRAIRN
jgi:Zn-dependent protease with chaperone function